MSDDGEASGETVLANIIRDLEQVQGLLARAEVTTEAATNRLKIYRDRYDDDGDGSGNKTYYGGPGDD